MFISAPLEKLRQRRSRRLEWAYPKPIQNYPQIWDKPLVGGLGLFAKLAEL